MKLALMLLTMLSVGYVSRTAAADPCSGNFCKNTTISRLYPGGDVNDPRVFIMPKDAGQQFLNCTPVSGVYVTLKVTHPLFAESYAALLDATTNNKKVWLRVKDGSPDCELAYITVENP
jgi:hypothetical protein